MPKSTKRSITRNIIIIATRVIVKVKKWKKSQLKNPKILLLKNQRKRDPLRDTLANTISSKVKTISTPMTSSVNKNLKTKRS